MFVRNKYFEGRRIVSYPCPKHAPPVERLSLEVQVFPGWAYYYNEIEECHDPPPLPKLNRKQFNLPMKPWKRKLKRRKRKPILETTPVSSQRHTRVYRKRQNPNQRNSRTGRFTTQKCKNTRKQMTKKIRKPKNGGNAKWQIASGICEWGVRGNLK